MVSLAVAGVVALAIYSTFRVQGRSYNEQEHTAVLQQNLRSAMLRMEREIRMAGFDSRGLIGAGVVSASSTSIHFTKHENSDGDLDDDNEDVTYNIDQSNLELDRNNRTVGENVNTLTLQYFDKDGVQLADPVPESQIGDIRTVIVQLNATMDTSSNPSLPNTITRTLSSVIKCRNLGNWS
jgi:type II secretory pathway component PulJ